MSSTTGEILDIPEDAYHRDEIGDDRPALSKSVMNELLTKSPAHARETHPKLRTGLPAEKPEAKFDVGTAVHQLFLEGDESRVVVFDCGDWKKPANRAERDLARERGGTPLLRHQWERVVEMRESLVSQLPRWTPIFVDGESEVTITWEEEGGVLCKARLDYLRDDRLAIGDLKSTGASAAPEAWSRTAYGMNAPLQEAWYRRGCRAVFGVDPLFFFCVIETTAPYAIQVYDVGPASHAIANQEIELALGIWRRCLETGEWPAYPPRIASIEPPGWKENAMWEREYREEQAA